MEQLLQPYLPGFSPKTPSEIVQEKVSNCLKKQEKSLNIWQLQYTQGSEIEIDLIDFEKFSHLTELSLSSIQISDWSFLKKLPNLKKLNISGTGIEDISILQHLDQLEFLNISFNNITDISLLRNFTKLKSLDISCTQVEDMSVLKNCTKIKKLHIDGTKITTIEVLADLKNLQTLHVYNVQIDDFSPLKHLKNLKKIVSYGMSWDLSFLEQSKNIQVLDLMGCKISNSQCIWNFSQLKKLSLEQCQSIDFPLLEVFHQPMTHLTHLNLIGYELSNFDSETEKRLFPNLVEITIGDHDSGQDIHVKQYGKVVEIIPTCPGILEVLLEQAADELYKKLNIGPYEEDWRK